eukprot:scaffold2752_cov393-Prasinococcus_capsulatus_cf.AAC.13
MVFHLGSQRSPKRTYVDGARIVRTRQSLERTPLSNSMHSGTGFGSEQPELGLRHREAGLAVQYRIVQMQLASLDDECRTQLGPRKFVKWTVLDTLTSDGGQATAPANRLQECKTLILQGALNAIASLSYLEELFYPCSAQLVDFCGCYIDLILYVTMLSIYSASIRVHGHAPSNNRAR